MEPKPTERSTTRRRIASRTENDAETPETVVEFPSVAESCSTGRCLSGTGSALSSTPSVLADDDLYPLTQEDYHQVLTQERQKFHALVRHASRYVFEEYCSITNEQLRHIECLPNSPSSTRPVSIDKLPFPRQIGDRTFFCGRQSDLNSLLRYFTIDLKEGRPRIKVISGYGGLGKTQFAFEYAYRWRKNYSGGVFYFDLESLSTFHDSIKDNLVILGLSLLGKVSQDFEKLQETLQRWPRCLFIYDGADKLAVLKDYIPSIAVDVIITSRIANIDHHQLPRNSKLDLKVLDVTTSLQILVTGFPESDGIQRSLDDFRKEHPEDFRYAERIAGKECLHGLPLALRHAASFRWSQGPLFSFKDLWEKLLGDKSLISLDPANVKDWLKNYDLKQIGPTLEALHLESLEDLRKLSQKRVHDSDLSDEEKCELLKAKEELVRAPAYITWRLDIESSCLKSPLGSDVLRFSAMLPSNDIPEDLLVRAVILRNRGFDETGVRTAIYHAKTHSLLTDVTAVTVSEGQVGRTFAMHMMIQYSVTKYLLQGKEHEQVLICLGAALCRSLPSADDFQKELKLADNAVKCFALHLFHVASSIVESSSQLRNRWQRRTLELACILSIRLLDADIGLPLCRRRLANARKGDRKEEQANALIQVGYCHCIKIESDKASALFEEAIRILGDRPSSREPPVVERWGEALFEIIRAYRLVHSMDRVETIAKKMKTGLEWANATECQSYAQCINSIGVCLAFQGCSFEEEYALSQLALEVYRKTLPEEHPNIATEFSNIATQYLRQGMYPDAEDYALKSLKIRTKCLPSNHFHHASSHWLLGYIYLCWGRFENAGYCLAQALDIVNSTCVSYVTLATLQTLAEWQAVVGRKEEAEMNQQRAMELMERVVGDHDRNSRAKAIYRSGRCWVSLGRHKEAEESLRKAIDLLEGVPAHHDVYIKVSALLGQCLVAQCKYTEAEHLLETVLEVQEKLKQQQTPQRGASLHWLGVCFLNQGYADIAEQLLREAAELRVRVLVHNDMRTADSYNELGHCLVCLGRHEEAEQVMEHSLRMKRLYKGISCGNDNDTPVGQQSGEHKKAETQILTCKDCTQALAIPRGAISVLITWLLSNLNVRIFLFFIFALICLIFIIVSVC